MKILHSVASLDPASGGPARSVPQLALALARRGHEVGLWAPVGGVSGGGVSGDSGDESTSKPEAPKDRNTEGPILADLDVEEAGKLRVFSGDFEEALEAFGHPDLVHDHGIWLPCHRGVAKVCRTRGIPRIVSPRGMLEPWALNHKKWKKRLAWWLYQRRDLHSAAGLHATADSEASQLRKLGLKAPMVVAANGVRLPGEASEGLKVEGRRSDVTGAGIRTSTTSFPSADLRLSDLRPSTTFTALFLSRIHPKKGLLMLVEAWAKVQPVGWRMRVVGPDEGGHLAEVKREVAAAGLAEAWEFSNSLEGQAKWRAMAEADLFILPSYSENFGIVVAEALAAGTPVITTTGTPWEGLQEHECGWWVAPEVEALTSALRVATGLSGEKRQEMGARGRQWVAEEFGWSGIAERVEGFYGEVSRVA